VDNKAPLPASDIAIWGSAAAAGAKLYVFGIGAKTLVYAPLSVSWTIRTFSPAAAGRAASRVFVNGKTRIELVGGGTDNWQYVP